MHKYGTMMAGGVVAFFAFKLFAALLLPALAAVFGLVMTVAKFALIAAVIYAVLTFFRGRRTRKAEA